MTRTYEVAREQVSDEAHAYEADAQRPLAGYLGIMSTYGVGVLGLGTLFALMRKPLPQRPSAGDLALVALATAKVSRLFTRDPVTSPLRAPFTKFESTSGPAEVNEDSRGHGSRHAVGELVTCPFCMGQWVATGFAFGLLFAPKITRQVAGTFAALEAVDFLQFGRAIAEHAAIASE